MRIVNLRVRGFKRLQELELDCDHDRLLVVGPNEAGKSTLLECVMAGLYGLAPAKRGSGHAGVLKDVAPWSGQACGLSLSFRVDDGRLLETDWDFTGERTQVIDHTVGEDITATFSSGTHGWLDVGHSLLALPGTVFRQFSYVVEGELATISDDAEIRESLLRLTDSGVDVLVEQAIGRLEEGARQASIPKVNSATLRNELAKQLDAAEGELTAARSAREALETEVEAIDGTEQALDDLRDELALMLEEEERREEQRRNLSSEIDRARGRLAEAELRLASLTADQKAAGIADETWSDAEMDEARQLLVAQEPTTRRRGLSFVALALSLAGIAALVVGLLLQTLLLAGAGAVLIGVGVVVLTRGSRAFSGGDLKVGERTFGSRQALMAALDHERARRDLEAQEATVWELQARITQLMLEPAMARGEGAASDGGGAIGPESTLEERLAEANTRQYNLLLQLERQKSSLDRGTSQIPDVAPIEERVATLQAAIGELEDYGAACQLGVDYLARASEEIRRAYAPKLQKYLSRDLPRVTGGRYSEAVVNERFEVLLRAPETNSMVEMSKLSRGTQQQVYLLLRLGLLEIVGASGERLPLFLDDALALSDDDRRAELLRVLEAEDRQVIYFTAREGQAAAAFGDRWHRIELRPPSGGVLSPDLKVLETPTA